jgi:16S rRNA (guanine966-N2)-methyltransferase
VQELVGTVRIIGGTWAGVDLVSPGPRVRPTREEVRDAWLTGLEPDLGGARVLDLFSGTGALGLEALSRGATSVDFVENGAPALHALKANLAKLRAKGRTRLFKKDVFAFLEGVPSGTGSGAGGGSDHGPTPGPTLPHDLALAGPTLPYDLALADPPYTSRASERLVSLWLERPFSRILCVEHGADRSLPGRGRVRRFEDTAITTLRIRVPKPGS